MPASQKERAKKPLSRLPHLLRVPLASIDLSDNGLSQRTINLYRSAIRQILRRAVGRVIPTNPEEQVHLTAVGRKEEQRRALTEEEQQWMLFPGDNPAHEEICLSVGKRLISVPITAKSIFLTDC